MGLILLGIGGKHFAGEPQLCLVLANSPPHELPTIARALIIINATSASVAVRTACCGLVRRQSMHHARCALRIPAPPFPLASGARRQPLVSVYATRCHFSLHLARSAGSCSRHVRWRRARHLSGRCRPDHRRAGRAVAICRRGRKSPRARGGGESLRRTRSCTGSTREALSPTGRRRTQGRRPVQDRPRPSCAERRRARN